MKMKTSTHSRTTVLVAIATLVGLAGCEGTFDHGPPLTDLAAVVSPAGPGSGEPNLTVDGRGGVYLSWLEPTDAGHALRLAEWAGDGWGEPRTVIDRSGLFVNWADFPSLAVFGDGVLAAHWLEMSGPGTYSYDVRVALSDDRGRSWRDERVLHRDGVQAEHGFVSLVPTAAGSGEPRLAALWLDGRATVDGEPMTLRFTTMDPSGELDPSVRVDASVCDCCQTAMARAADGLVAAYRDRTDDEIRDIYVARYVDGEWTEGRPVHHDGWEIAGCPVNGPALATHGDTVAVAWFTAAELEGDGARTREEVRAAGERGRVLAAFSTDGGESFGPPVRVDDGAAMGRVDLLWADGHALVSWLERTDAGAQVRVRRAEPHGVGPALPIAGAAAERATGFPRMIRSGDRVVFAWTGSGDAGVRTAVARLPGADGDGDEGLEGY